MKETLDSVISSRLSTWDWSVFFRTPAFLASDGCLSVVEVPPLLFAVVVLAKEQVQGTLHQVICLVQERAVDVNKALVRIVSLLLVAPQL